MFRFFKFSYCEQYVSKERYDLMLKDNCAYFRTVTKKNKSSLCRKEIEVFTAQGIILSKNLLDYGDMELSKMTQIHPKRIQNLQKITQAMIS